MTDENLEDEVRATLHAKARVLDVDDRDFDPSMGSVVEIDDAPRKRSRTLWSALVAAAVIIAVIAVAVAVRSPGSSKPAVGEHTGTIPPTTAPPTASELVQQITSIPASVFQVVGTGSASAPTLPALPGPPWRDTQGRVRILYVGAEYCPFCAGERWPVIMALSHFGTFSDLGLTNSAKVTTVGSPEVFPGTQIFSFHGATYTSDYIDFQAVEAQNNKYEPLDEMTTEQNSVFTKYDAPPHVDSASAGSIPFVDIGDQFLISGATFDVGVLQDKSHAEIAAALSDPASDIAKAIDGSANVITNALCAAVDPDRNKVPVCREVSSGKTGSSGPGASTGPTGPYSPAVTGPTGG